jgi:hypothetical protein
MRDYFLEIRNTVATWGNHNRKYLRAIAASVDTLRTRLEARGQIDEVHLWHPAFDLGREMNTVMAVGDSPREKLDLLGCYVALQFVQMNLQNLDTLGLDLSRTPVSSTGVYRNFMRRAGNEFRALTAAYMGKLLEFYLEGRRVPRFVICGVGTRADQDDIDVGVIDDGGEGREDFSQAIGWMSWEMLRHASSLHFHLSEHIGTQSFTASISEYQAILDREVSEFVVVAELLGAIPIIGQQELFEEFCRKVTDRYFYRPRGDNRYHESYLRGILGETKSLLARPLGRNWIHPKDDVLRLVKGIISAKKTLYGVREVNAWDILDQLKKKDFKRAGQYAALEASLSFVEVFRHLYQLFAVQQEEVFLDEANTLESLGLVGRTMGYQDVGVVPARDYLLVHYYDHVRQIREAIPPLVADLRKHLQRRSVFAGILASGEYSGNLAVDVLSKLSFFRGVTFWDDLLRGLQDPERVLLDRFLRDLGQLEPSVRGKLVHRYLDWLAQDLPSSLSFLVLLGGQQVSTDGEGVFSEFNRVFLERAASLPDFGRGIADAFTLYPELLNAYFGLLDPRSHEVFLGLLEVVVPEEEVAQVLEIVKQLCLLHYSTSRYFRRFFQRVSNRYAESIRAIDNPDRLGEMARGALGQIKAVNSFAEKKEKLGEYYDLMFLRIGLLTLRGAAAADTNHEFTNLSDEYLDTLFDLCHREVEAELSSEVNTRDLLAILATGGHGRGQAFHDDCDLITVLNSQDPVLLEQCTKIISRMNREIIRRGMCPHHRLAEQVGRFVVLQDELEDLLAEGSAETFIDQSQILGSRLVVGSPRFQDQFEQRIVIPLIFQRADTYIREMQAELRSRHEAERRGEMWALDVKEVAGGLRDIEMLLLMYKARYAIREPLHQGLFNTLAEVDPSHTEDLRTLAETFLFLKRLRDVYRLSCAASDTLEVGCLASTADTLGFVAAKGRGKEDYLLEEFREKTAEADRIVQDLSTLLAGETVAVT